jgi:prolipoprotein diacylglyceryl transferase
VLIPLSIPSPSSPYVFHLGSLHPRWYGLLLALGVLVGGRMARREMRRRGIDPELAYPIAVWGVPFGLVGARLYHVITDWGAFWPHHLADLPKIWQGGLGIWGAVLGGMLGVWIGARRSRHPLWLVADCIAPGLIHAQALGRWGNYANQELYGRPSSLPWAVEISPPHRYSPYEAYSTFQPMFLYESIWDGAACLVLVWFARRYWQRVSLGTVFALYVALYCAIRLPLETMKIDPADHVLGQRVNVWVAAIALLTGITWFLLALRRGHPQRPVVIPQVAAAAHTPTRRPEAAIAARRASKERKK